MRGRARIRVKTALAAWKAWAMGYGMHFFNWTWLYKEQEIHKDRVNETLAKKRRGSSSSVHTSLRENANLHSLSGRPPSGEQQGSR